MTWSERVVHLYCFSPAGVSAGMFAAWQAAMPPGVKLFPLDRPGRFAGATAGCVVTSHALMADMLAADIARDLEHARKRSSFGGYACLGLGEGAALAFSVAARVEHQTGVSPLHCFVGYGQAPHVERRAISHLTHRALMMAFVCEPGRFGTCSELRDHTACTLPLLRADLVADEGAGIDADVAIDAPLEVLDTGCSAADWTGYSTRAVRTHAPRPSDGATGAAASLRDVAAAVLSSDGRTTWRATSWPQGAAVHAARPMGAHTDVGAVPCK